jgi:hypothetical protein
MVLSVQAVANFEKRQPSTVTNGHCTSRAFQSTALTQHIAIRLISRMIKLGWITRDMANSVGGGDGSGQRVVWLC